MGRACGERKMVKYTDSGAFLEDEQGNDPFAPLSAEQILADLSEARDQIAAGEGIPAEKALSEIGKVHGFF